jgi:sec-independent protein translocase protein TatC
VATKMRSETFQTAAPKTVKTAQDNNQPLPTFLDHVHELRRRLFWVVALVLIASSVSYSFLNAIIDVLTRPLGDMRLFYLTPGGGLSFSFKLCAYVGIIVAVPLIMYHLYRFLEPLMGNIRKSAVFYVGLSSSLAIAGVLFAYFISLPAALRFLTGFNMNHIQAMLTADSYLSFVVTYLLGAALLFQIPLLLMIINTMTPLKPSKLMKQQRFVIVGAFILGAIISPTPDMMNQTFLALPVIGMYQLGVIMVWLQNRSRDRKRSSVPVAAQIARQNPQRPQGKHFIPDDVLEELVRPRPAVQAAALVSRPKVVAQALVQPKRRALSSRTVFSDVAPRYVQPSARSVRTVVAPPRPLQPRPAPRLNVPTRTVDGFAPYRSQVFPGTS